MVKRAIVTAGVFLGGLCLAALVAGPATATQPEVRLEVPYGPDPAEKLDLCLPAGQEGAPRPAVVMIHGGYWITGDKAMYGELCRLAASEGIVAAAIDYRLADAGEGHRWPAQLVDAQLAVRWLRSRAAELAIDPKRICALGDSAGAHLAVFLAALGQTVPGDHARELPGISSRVACAVDNFGPVDISADTLWPPDQQLFGVKGRAPDQEREASPIFRIGPATAPIMIVHGRADKSVNVDQSLMLLDRLKAGHVPARLTLLDCGHEFEGLSAQATFKVWQSELTFIKEARGRDSGSS